MAMKYLQAAYIANEGTAQVKLLQKSTAFYNAWLGTTHKRKRKA